MSGLLEHLQREHAFNPTPRHLDLARFHVRFDDLLGARAVESRLDGAVRRGGRVVLVGSSGCGKSSVIQGVLGPLAEGVAPILVPVASQPTGTITEPSTVADLLIRTLANHAEATTRIDERQEAAFLLESQSHRQVRTGRDVRATFGARWLGGELATDIRRQTEGSVAIDPDAKLDVVAQLLTIIAAWDLVPVLVFDDTDRWLQRTGIEEPQRIVEGFFGRVLRWAAELGCAVVVAAHSAYFPDSATRRRLLATLETQVEVPRLDSSRRMARLFERRVSWSCDGTGFDGATVGDVFEDAAVAALHRSYAERGLGLREVVLVAHVALTEACDAGSERITASLIASALAA